MVVLNNVIHGSMTTDLKNYFIFKVILKWFFISVSMTVTTTHLNSECVIHVEILYIL
jgi:hypothetical protein